MTLETLKIPLYWKELVEEVHRSKGVVMVLGASDTGKTTLAYFLSRELCKKGNKVSMISADMGQCAFGPPATLGMALLESVPRSLRDIPVHTMYFIGATSPVGHLLQTVVGVKKLVEKAFKEGMEFVVVDTTGFVQGGAAWELKFQKIELTDTRHIVALQRDQELEDILRPQEHRAGRRVYRLKVLEEARARSYEQRRDYRRERFAEYFREITHQTLSMRSVRLVNPVNIPLETRAVETFQRLLVGLNDDDNLCLALGVIEKMDIKSGKLSILTPLRDLKDVKMVRFGSIRIEEDWSDTRTKPR
ncbi:MAG: Clp1/GlmU family protein [Candidatus Brocadiales bacterium]|nr:Clp1/GlmU family protein [Candidatus Brocadiales bacterium]